MKHEALWILLNMSSDLATEQQIKIIFQLYEDGEQTLFSRIEENLG